MFSYQIKIGLGQTDATGVLFFPQQFSFCVQTLEAFLENRGFPLSQLLQSPYLFPVVHAEADYLKPLTIGSELEICLQVDRVGISSVTFVYTLVKDGDLVGKVLLTHVVIDRLTKETREIPPDFKNLFQL